jgi:predicted membrane-bound spermidine synthase
MPLRPILLLFFLSGAAGLVFEVIWIRQFGNTFGNTIYSASLVTAVFMSGLGIGSYLAGILADRRVRGDPRDLLRLYGWFELAIAALGLGLAFLLPELEALSAATSRYVVGENGWRELSAGSHAARYVVCIALLLPITTLMGGTLTILIRYLLARSLAQVPWQIGLLFGVNTAGAALGCLLVDFSLIPSFGLLATQGIAASLNVTAALGALLLAARTPSLVPAEDAGGPGPEADAAEDRSDARRLVLFTSLAIFASGFAGMGMEILWFRFLGSMLGGLRSVMSLVLGVMLSGMWLGSFCAGWVNQRVGRPDRVYAVAQATFVVASLVLLLAFDPALRNTAPLRQAAGPDPDAMTRWLYDLWFQLRAILLVVGPPAFLMGFAYPTANAHLQRRFEAVGRRAGILYLANNAGAVLGSLGCGFVLLPWLGSQRAAFLLALVALAPIPLIFASTSRRTGDADAPREVGRLRWVAALALFACLGFWSLLPPDHLARKPFSVGQQRAMLAVSEGITETVAVVDAPKTRDRILFTNGYLMSGTPLKAQRYMRSFVHLPLLQIDRPEDVLIICFGIGNTAHAASLYESVERIDVVDLSRNVLEHADWFVEWNHGVLRDERTRVFVNDGRQHLRMGEGDDYDLITLEPPPIHHAGVSSLYSTEFYELARGRLKDGGFVTQWFPSYQVPEDVARSVIRAFVEVFPDAILLSGFQRHLVLMGRKGTPPRIDPLEVAGRLARNPAVAADLESIRMGTVTEVIGSFAGGPRALARASRDAEPVTDDHPAMEYQTSHVFTGHRVPRDMFDVDEIGFWCPTCFGPAGAAAAPHLDGYLQLSAAVYAAPWFLETDPFGRRAGGGIELPRDPGLLPAYRASEYLRTILPGLDDYLRQLVGPTAAVRP